MKKRWKKYVKSRDQNDYEDYKRLQRICTKEVKVAKRNFEQNLAENSKENPKAFQIHLIKTGLIVIS